MEVEKNTEAIMIRISPTLLERVEAVAAKTKLKPAALARMGLIEVVDRLAATTPVIDPALAAAVAAAKARGLDVEQILTAALEAHTETGAAQPA